MEGRGQLLLANCLHYILPSLLLLLLFLLLLLMLLLLLLFLANCLHYNLPPAPAPTTCLHGTRGAITVKIFSSPQPSLNIFSSPRNRLYCNYIVVAIIEDTYAYMPPHTDQSDSNKLNIKAHPPKKQNILTI